MQRTVVIVGAGGKMGARAAEKIGKDSRFRVLLCESDAVRASQLEHDGFQVVSTESALPQADFVVLAVPDALIGRIARQLAPSMKSDGTLIMLDAAAAYVNELPDPGSLTFMIPPPAKMFAGTESRAPGSAASPRKQTGARGRSRTNRASLTARPDRRSPSGESCCLVRSR